MRIDELDQTHKEFKKTILNQELTEEQLDEILPALLAPVGMALGTAARVGVQAVGTAARVGAQAVGTLARGAGAVARGVGQAATQTAKTIGRSATNVAKNTAKNQINKKVNSLKTNTANKLSGQNNTSQGTTGTVGTNQQQTKLQRGAQISVPQTDPKNPGKSIPTAMKVKSVTGSNVELQPQKKQKGQPTVVKFNKKDLQLQ